MAARPKRAMKPSQRVIDAVAAAPAAAARQPESNTEGDLSSDDDDAKPAPELDAVLGD